VIATASQSGIVFLVSTLNLHLRASLMAGHPPNADATRLA
jgi:hypothetical protein